MLTKLTTPPMLVPAHKTEQEHKYYSAVRDYAQVNLTFLEMLSGPRPITQGELTILIARNPSTWAKFQKWLPKLPE